MLFSRGYLAQYGFSKIGTIFIDTNKRLIVERSRLCKMFLIVRCSIKLFTILKVNYFNFQLVMPCSRGALHTVSASRLCQWTLGVSARSLLFLEAKTFTIIPHDHDQVRWAWQCCLS